MFCKNTGCLGYTGIKGKVNLQLLNTRQFKCGVTELNYLVDRG